MGFWAAILSDNGQKAVSATFGIIFTGIALVSLLTIRPPARSSLDITGVTSVKLTVAQNVEFWAYGQGLHLGYPSGQVDVELPTPRSDCNRIAASLGVNCDTSGSMTLMTTLDAGWDAAELFTLIAHDRRDGKFFIDSPGYIDSIEASVSGGGPATLCLSAGIDSARLTLGPSKIPVTIGPSTTASSVDCSKGVTIHLASRDPSGESGFVIDHVSNASIILTGSEAAISSQKIVVTAASARRGPVASPLTVVSDSPFKLTTIGFPPNATESHVVWVSNAVHLIDGDGSENVPSLWELWQWANILLPAFSGLAGILGGWIVINQVRKASEGQHWT